ncbi:MAG: hypothetical protein ACKORI_06500, partial [Verrucomicrobiota bacterium]
MKTGTWLWKVALSLIALAVSWAEFYPLAPTPFEQFVPTQVIEKADDFAKLHQEALARLKADASVPADRRSVSYFQALRDIGEGKGRDKGVDLRPFFFREDEVVREPELGKRNALVLKELLRRSQGRLRLGLDLQGGVAFTLKVDPTGAESGGTGESERAKVPPSEMVAQAVKVMEQRINSFGVA